MINTKSKKSQRLAIVDNSRCKPKDCSHECMKKCPSNSHGKKCIDIEDSGPKGKAIIAENMCIGCGICVKVCPFNAIMIVNLPDETQNIAVHQYGKNGFSLYGFPLLRTGQVMGVLGANGIGKSTMVKILSGEIVPNFKLDKKPESIMPHIRKFGASVKNYFTTLHGRSKIVIKHQDMQYYVDKDSDLSYLSGGERQLKVCKQIADTESDVYIFDEPTNYLDVKQRLIVARIIQNLCNDNRFVIVIDHDISFLDYACDMISIIYGVSAAYGIVSKPYKTADGINNYFEGYLPAENIRFRRKPFTYGRNLENIDQELISNPTDLNYLDVYVQYDGFKLYVPAGIVPCQSSVTILLGENGTGKTTFLKELHDQLKITVSVKSQYPKFASIKSGCTVKELLFNHAVKATTDQMFRSDVVKPLNIDAIMDKRVKELSGGEQQRLAIVCCLSQESEFYFLDEPSAMLDIEQRVNLCKVITRFVSHTRKAVFIVEHDISVVLSISRDLNSHVIVFDKEHSKASKPMNMQNGINIFLKSLDVTFRRSELYRRHRINKLGSVTDNEQRKLGRYFMD
jgi:ATP-binding cassette subfamily E protein 1